METDGEGWPVTKISDCDYIVHVLTTNPEAFKLWGASPDASQNIRNKIIKISETLKKKKKKR